MTDAKQQPVSGIASIRKLLESLRRHTVRADSSATQQRQNLRNPTIALSGTGETGGACRAGRGPRGPRVPRLGLGCGLAALRYFLVPPPQRPGPIRTLPTGRGAQRSQADHNCPPHARAVAETRAPAPAGLGTPLRALSDPRQSAPPQSPPTRSRAAAELLERRAPAASRPGLRDRRPTTRLT